MRRKIRLINGFASVGRVLILSGHVELAVELIEKANDIMNACLGPHHIDSLKVMHTLAQVYAKLGRHEKAAAMKENVKKHAEVLEPNEQQFMR